MIPIGNEDRDDPYQIEIQATIHALLSDQNYNPINWNAVNSLLQKLSTTSKSRYGSTEYDPMGRLLLGRLLSRNPPAVSLEAALRVFPHSLSHNPAAFFTACSDASPEIVAHMMRHTLTLQASNNDYDDQKDDECPYPWIMSHHITMEGAKALLEVYPQGVLKSSSFLSSYSPLDFFLMSTEMIEHRNFDMALWNKFKLMLMAAECCVNGDCSGQNGSISPVHTILKRVFSRPGMYRYMEWNAVVPFFLQLLTLFVSLRLFGQYQAISTCPMVATSAPVDGPMGL
jgi:hypothetical protein